MTRRELVIENARGLHARAAARLVAVTSRFQSRITLRRAGHLERIDGKSILGILMMAASLGTRIEVSAEGVDEREAIDAVTALFNAHFTEPVEP